MARDRPGQLAGPIDVSLVEVPGIEPGSSAALSGLLRAQLAMSLLGPTVHASETVRRAQPRLISPCRPRGEVCLASLLDDAGYWAEGLLRPTEWLLASGGESQLSAIKLGAYWFPTSINETALASSARFPCRNVQSRNLSP